MIAIVDYGLGNVQAFQNAYFRLGVPCIAARTREDLEKATQIILPGVGAFDDAMRRLGESGMRAALERCVRERGLPLLGVCVGMQILAGGSDEGRLPGLGWVRGHVRQFRPAASGERTRVPHMGWNDIRTKAADPLFAGLEDAARFYFLHSYYFEAEEPGSTVAVTDYGGPFTCAVREGSVCGVQFHPEKSHRWGLRLLENFAKAERWPGPSTGGRL